MIGHRVDCVCLCVCLVGKKLVDVARTNSLRLHGWPLERCQGPEAEVVVWGGMQSVCVLCVCARVCSQAIAIAVCEGGFGELHHSGPALPDDFWSTTQQLLGFCESFSQLFLPLHKLWVTLQGKKIKMTKLISFMFGGKRRSSSSVGLWTYLALQHKLLPAFDTQQDAFLVFNLRLFHRHYLLHRQQVLLWTKSEMSKVEVHPCRTQKTLHQGWADTLLFRAVAKDYFHCWLICTLLSW